MKRLLFIGHDATRTGAPFVLLYLLRWIGAQHPEVITDLLLLAGGEIETLYGEVANVTVVPIREPGSVISNKIHSLRARLSDEVRLGLAGLPHLSEKYDAVIGNTAVTLRHLGIFKRRGFKTISWMHELDGALATLGVADEFGTLSRGVDRFIVGSDAVGDMLRRRGIKQPIHRVYEIAPPAPGTAVDVAAIKNDLALPDGAFVVGACGTLEHRKGADLFVHLADRLKSRSNFYFIWVARANAASEPMYAGVTGLVSSLGLSDRFRIVLSAAGEHERYLSAMDVFVLPSREDPFPLVCLEAANRSKPVICFAGAGGMPEFVGEDAGSVVPLGDMNALAAAVEKFYLDPAARLDAGAAARRKTENEFSADRSCSQFFDILADVD